MKISFIIASVDRDKQLQQCISSIEKAHGYKKDIPIEVLVVIQQAKQKKDIRVSCPAMTTFYYTDKMGLSAARNFAIEKSEGDYLVFIDDDASVSENFIDVLSRKVMAFEKVNAFCGRLMDPVGGGAFSCLFYRNDVKKLGRFDFQYFMGSAHVLSKEVIKRIGGYDERFGVGAAYYGSEETDMFFRLKAAGQEVIYLPDLIFFHPIPVGHPRYVYNYSYAMGAMLTKNCVNDKAYFFVYVFIALKATIKASIRILQKFIFWGRYKDKDQRYHYGSVIRGTWAGIKCYISKEL